MEKNGKLKVTLLKSIIGTRSEHRACIRGLGLRHINHTVEVEDTSSNRGLIGKASYLLRYETSN